jgi:hypothetical protein
VAAPTPQPAPIADGRRHLSPDALDAEVDRMLMDSFPASDPPQWDSLSVRARQKAPPGRQR